MTERDLLSGRTDANAEFDRVEIEVKRSELLLNEAELKLKQKEFSKPVWLSPIFAAIAAAALAALGNLVVSAVNSNREIQLEDRKAEQGRILEMLKTGDPDKAAENLEFLISTGLISDEETLIKIKSYLAVRKPGQGASLGSTGVGGDSSGRIWDSRDIPICFENPSEVAQEHIDLVKASASDTWEKHSSISFTGWDECGESANAVRIRFADEAPHAKKIGRELRGLASGLVLNTKFEEWSPACQKTIEECIIGTVVHSFGHVLGFSHENNRLDAPIECRELAQGDSNVVVVGPYDPESVMNYCNPIWNNGGVLSNGDKAKLAIVYGDK